MPFRLGVVVFLGFAASAAAAPPDAAEFFESKVRPLLAEHCVACHGPKKQQSGLRLDTKQGMLTGADDGPVVVPGDPDKSALIKAVRYADDPRMPPRGKLPDAAVADLVTWVKMGAPWPDAAQESKVRPADDAAKAHWAFRPLPRPTDGSIDSFVQTTLKAKGLAPNPPADRRTLLRRLAYDLTGLPPTAEEMDAFTADQSPDAFEKVVDRLLASPAFGERWGRYWLDLARYADNRGYVGVNVERTYPYAYTYRDWVVSALNRDLPYDRFLKCQIAADHLGGESTDLAALGFFTVGRRFLNNINDIIDDRIDVLCRTTMALTVGCARCHDHKFDPIPTRDYYSLYGVFASCHEPDDLPLLRTDNSGPEYEAYAKELKRLEDEKAKFEKDNAEMKAKERRKFQEQIKPFENKIKKLTATHPGAPPRAMVLRDNDRPSEPVVFVRGNPNNRGPAVPRQFIGFLSGPERKLFATGSGRLELANAIASPTNPLTARVAVNRVWLHLFGQGLVRTPSDFGLRSDPPTHPELLDHLATGFVADGWSVKRLIRRIVLSATYRQSSAASPEAMERDPDNRWLARTSRRRLDFEALRDSLLAASGNLDRTVGGRAVDLYGVVPSKRRTLYGFIDRQNLPGVMRTFDFALPDAHAPQRFTTTVPQQALFLMNSSFVQDQARALAKRVDGAGADRVTKLYRLALGRSPAADEVALALGFVGDKTDTWEQLAQVLLMSNEFAFVD